MKSQVHVDLLTPDDWERLRAIRLRALQANPEAFGGKYELEKIQSESKWRERFNKEDFLVASINGEDVGVLYIEVLDGDHGATCWIGGCWTDSNFRGHGVMRALFNFIDAHAVEKDWTRQGLGVYIDNEGAVKVYEALGFSFAGEKFASTESPGRFFQHMVRDSV